MPVEKFLMYRIQLRPAVAGIGSGAMVNLVVFSSLVVMDGSIFHPNKSVCKEHIQELSTYFIRYVSTPINLRIIDRLLVTIYSQKY